MNMERSEVEKINEVAQKYRKDGYVVLVNPKPSELPRTLRGYQPDLIAHKGDEKVVVEVTSRRGLAAKSKLSELASHVAKMKGWRFDLQTFEIGRIERERQGVPVFINDINVRLKSATLLLRRDPESALVVAWSAFEGILRYLTNFLDMPVRPWSGQRAMKQLISNGYVRRSDYELFIRGLETRNQIVHGASASQSVAPLTRSVIATVQHLINECNELQSSRQSLIP